MVAGCSGLRGSHWGHVGQCWDGKALLAHWSLLCRSQYPCSWLWMAFTWGEWLDGSPGPWLLGAGVKKCSCSQRGEQCWVGSEILIVMCKVGLVLLVHLPASLFHTLCHPRWATAEHPDLLHLGKEGAKGVRLQHQFSLQSSPS